MTHGDSPAPLPMDALLHRGTSSKVSTQNSAKTEQQTLIYHLHPKLELVSEQQQVRLTEMSWGKRRLRTKPPHGTSATLPSRAWQEPRGADAVEKTGQRSAFPFFPCELENFSLSILTMRHGKWKTALKPAKQPLTG